MPMTKKHFISLADAVRAHNAFELRNISGSGDAFTVNQIAALADWCADQNPRFDHDRWLGYIAGTNGPSGGKR